MDNPELQTAGRNGQAVKYTHSRGLSYLDV